MPTPSRRELANAIRALAMDAVEAGQLRPSRHADGHGRHRRSAVERLPAHNPANPQWPDRDRFVLSNGHGSMLLYALLHLTGYDLPIEELKHFRQLHSKTAGPPEVGITPGVETTTGPLGQGLANAVGMALAEKLLAQRVQPRRATTIVDHHTYVFLGDGCLMEGISHEACSLAGTWGLGKLVAFYDDNGISIDGQVDGWFTDDTPARFEAYGWHVIRDVDGHDAGRDQAPRSSRAAQTPDKPTLICCQTMIGLGSPNKAGQGPAHGAPLGKDEIAARARAAGLDARAVRDPGRRSTPAGTPRDAGAGARSTSGTQLFAAYARAYPGAGRRIRCAASRASCRQTSPTTPTRYIAKLQAEGRDRRLAQGLADGDRGVRRRCCRSCSAARPT